MGCCSIYSMSCAMRYSIFVPNFLTHRYAQYLRYHEYICEKPELLGMTNHFLFVCKK